MVSLSFQLAHTYVFVWVDVNVCECVCVSMCAIAYACELVRIQKLSKSLTIVCVFVKQISNVL